MAPTTRAPLMAHDLYCPPEFALIPLTKGYHAIVDAADYEWLSRWKWYYHSAGYAARTKKEKKKKTQLFMHRVILQTPRGIRSDHKNRNRLDNRRDNLRVATPSNNNANRMKTQGSSSYKGVMKEPTRKNWVAKIQVNRQKIHLGSFSTEKEAAVAYDAAAKKHHGEFAMLNFPEGGE